MVLGRIPRLFYVCLRSRNNEKLRKMMTSQNCQKYKYDKAWQRLRNIEIFSQIGS